MTELRDTPHIVHAETSAEHHSEGAHARYRIATRLTDGAPADHTHLRDALGTPEAVNGRVATSSLRALAAALIEHADAIDLFCSSYREPEYDVLAPKPVEVFPGFPLTMTEREHVEELSWPVGVRARDSDGDVWERLVFGWRFVNPEFDKPNPEDSARLRNNLPASIIPTSWPTPAADTTTEN